MICGVVCFQHMLVLHNFCYRIYLCYQTDITLAEHIYLKCRKNKRVTLQNNVLVGLIFMVRGGWGSVPDFVVILRE